MLAVGRLEARDGESALDELRSVADARPDWTTARLTLATALLRRGRFDDAAREYTQLLGEDFVARLVAGAPPRERGETPPPDENAEAGGPPTELLGALLGLAICEDELGAVRRADQLYRAYADRVGITSPAAAAAFYRLAAMLERTFVPWGDPAAERARALALDPNVAESATLPAVPALGSDPATEPYTRVVELVGTPSGTDGASAAVDTTESAAPRVAPPVLAQYSAPYNTPAGVAGRTLEIELLVGAAGAVEDIQVDECERLDCGDLVALAFAASHWRFLPATADGEPVAARIRFPVPVPDPNESAPPPEPDGGAQETPDEALAEPRPERPGRSGGGGEEP